MLENSTALVVDDSASTRHLLVNILKNNFGCTKILQAGDGAEAMEMIENCVKVDWIFSDLEMPNMDGEEFLEEVRKDKNASQVPFFMVTSHNDIERLAKAAQKGVTDILIKPFSPNALEEKINKYLALKERRASRRVEVDKISNEVMVRLPGNKEFKANLVNVSHTGCLVRTAMLKTVSMHIYDDARLILLMGKEKILLRASVIRMERDGDFDVNGTKNMITAFEFEGIDPENMKRLEKFVGMFAADSMDIHLEDASDLN